MYTTLVQNRRQRLNGNKFIGFIVLLSFLSSCAVIQPKPRVPTESPVEKPVEPELPVEQKETKKPEDKVNSVVLLLPLQLNKIVGEPSRADVKRTEVPLDFYQGFKIAMENLTERGHSFKLTVLDSRDNEYHNSQLALRPEVQSADLIVGPIFPKEIPAFARAGKLSHSLQVSPLAASKPSQFNIPNLVSLVAPIDLHSIGVADYLERQRKSADNIVLINKLDEDSFSFLKPLKNSLTERTIYFSEVEDVEQVVGKVNSSGRNYVVVGTNNKFAVNSILQKLVEIQNELGITIELIGHPNWSRGSYDSFNLQLLKAKITTSYYVSSNKSNVRDFQRKYREEFKMEPSEYAYKGFDTGYFFGYMLGKYGPEYSDHMLAEEYKGLQTNYKFEKYPQWGYVNTYIRILEFDGYNYIPID